MNKMIAFIVAFAGLLSLTPPTGQAADRAEDILAATGLNGGLIVHLGCGDGKLTGALLANDSFRVHGLDADAANVAEARQHLHELGPVRQSVDRPVRRSADGSVVCLEANGR